MKKLTLLNELGSKDEKRFQKEESEELRWANEEDWNWGRH